MGRRQGLARGDRPNGRRAGIRRDVLALTIHQASTCLPAPVPRGARQRNRCPPPPGSHRVRAPKAPAISAQGHQATAKMKALAGKHPRKTLRLHEAREGAGRFSLPCSNGGTRVSANPTRAVPRRTGGDRRASLRRSPAHAGAQAPRRCTRAAPATAGGPGPPPARGNALGLRTTRIIAAASRSLPPEQLLDIPQRELHPRRPAMVALP